MTDSKHLPQPLWDAAGHEGCDLSCSAQAEGKGMGKGQKKGEVGGVVDIVEHTPTMQTWSMHQVLLE